MRTAEGKFVVCDEMNGDYEFLAAHSHRPPTSKLDEARFFDDYLQAWAVAIENGGAVGRVNAEGEVELV